MIPSKQNFHSNIKGNRNLQKEKKDHFERKESDHISKAVFNYNTKDKKSRKQKDFGRNRLIALNRAWEG